MWPLLKTQNSSDDFWTIVDFALVNKKVITRVLSFYYTATWYTKLPNINFGDLVFKKIIYR